MKSRELTAAAAPFVLVTALGLTGCSTIENQATKVGTIELSEDDCANPGPLEKVRFVEGNKEGDMYFENSGDCIGVYDHGMVQSIGTIAANEGFYMVCYDSEPDTFRVITSDGLEGSVNIGAAVSNTPITGELDADPVVPACEFPTVLA